MILSPTFGFKGTILPVINKTDKLYLLIENDNDNRVLLNIVSIDVNKFVNIDSKFTKIIYCGNYKKGLHLKVFYLGQELFDFNCDEFDKQTFLLYSNYIIKNTVNVDEVSFDPTFVDGFKLISTSKTPQNLFIQIINNDTNEIVYEDNFISSEPYTYKQNCFINYGIIVYNTDGKKIYSYDLNLKDKKVWIKLESNYIGESIEWIPYVEEFRKKHQCEVFCTTYWNNIFINEYPNIKFVSYNEIINFNPMFAIYKIKNDETEKLEKIAPKILGMEPKEIKLNDVLEHMKKVSISNNN